MSISSKKNLEHPSVHSLQRSVFKIEKFAFSSGTPVLAAADGEVISAKNFGKYGNQITIRYSDTVITKLAHGDKLLVKVGDQVAMGQIVMYSGRAGNGVEHLHYEVIETTQSPDKHGNFGPILDISHYHRPQDLKELLK